MGERARLGRSPACLVRAARPNEGARRSTRERAYSALLAPLCSRASSARASLPRRSLRAGALHEATGQHWQPLASSGTTNAAVGAQLDYKGSRWPLLMVGASRSLGWPAGRTAPAPESCAQSLAWA